jgi:hypothetical protein
VLVPAPRAVPSVAHDDVAGHVPVLDGHPQDVAPPRVVVEALDDAAMAPRRVVACDGEVPAVGGAVEEDVAGAAAHEAAHRPHRVQRRPVRAHGDAVPVLVGVDVRALDAGPQPHVRPVREAMHRRLVLLPRRIEADGGEGEGVGVGFLALWRGGRGGRGVRWDGYVWAQGRGEGEFQAQVARSVAGHASCALAGGASKARDRSRPASPAGCRHCHVGPRKLTLAAEAGDDFFSLPVLQAHKVMLVLGSSWDCSLLG